MIGQRLPKFYAYLVKEIFHNQKLGIVELHSTSRESVKVLAILIELLTRLGYAEICKIKTKQGIVYTREAGTGRNGRLIVHLKRTDQFE